MFFDKNIFPVFVAYDIYSDVCQELKNNSVNPDNAVLLKKFILVDDFIDYLKALLTYNFSADQYKDMIINTIDYFDALKDDF